MSFFLFKTVLLTFARFCPAMWASGYLSMANCFKCICYIKTGSTILNGVKDKPISVTPTQSVKVWKHQVLVCCGPKRSRVKAPSFSVLRTKAFSCESTKFWCSVDQIVWNVEAPSFGVLRTKELVWRRQGMHEVLQHILLYAVAHWRIQKSTRAGVLCGQSVNRFYNERMTI